MRYLHRYNIFNALREPLFLPLRRHFYSQIKSDGPDDALHKI